MQPKPLTRSRVQNRRFSEVNLEPSIDNVNEIDGLYDTDGIVIYIFVKEKPNIYITKTVTFEHPHRLTCNEWIDKLRDKISSKFFKIHYDE